MDIAIPAVDLTAVMPETILSVIAMVLLLVNAFVRSESKSYLGYLSVGGLIVTAVSAASSWDSPVGGFGGMVLQDNFSIFFTMIFLLGGILGVLITDHYLVKEGCNQGEIYPLML